MNTVLTQTNVYVNFWPENSMDMNSGEECKFMFAATA